jgi:hypothetical protein
MISGFDDRERRMHVGNTLVFLTNNTTTLPAVTIAALNKSRRQIELLKLVAWRGHGQIPSW